MYGKPFVIFAALSTFVSSTVAAPSQTPNIERRSYQLDIPEGSDWSVSYSCKSGNVDHSGTQADTGKCIKIDGDAPEFRFNYNDDIFHYFTMDMYVNDDCTEKDYGWWTNFWNGSKLGHKIQNMPNGCDLAAGSVKGDSFGETGVKFGSYKITAITRAALERPPSK
ncbi:uncharacterized protein K452DRAFT_309274 [Aplosporella prunicola CBS 121167]|uniref:AA1-like domain-containing protein n=1 Tax=Aplosporella prunicola CBS 121167 TaxID=1176127 RepID=A0A6A6BBE7_9PEZI|nr:uncharacterized protein K452DRAFT_309274 [Aplosporella prunicola CBS 121167]KAF2141529.1 hypothetical protein K452DRAFT_309274 [Aplosporella prunicola CBS 121167]